MERKMVLPGDEIAVAEEFEPGDGTYERNGLVFAATPGVLELDPANRVARVRAFNPPAELRVGDIVYGVVDDIRGMMATATILAIHGRTRQISGESDAAGPWKCAVAISTAPATSDRSAASSRRTMRTSSSPSPPPNSAAAESRSASVEAVAGKIESAGARIGAVAAAAGIGIAVAVDATDGVEDAAEGTAIAIDVVSPR